MKMAQKEDKLFVIVMLLKLSHPTGIPLYVTCLLAKHYNLVLNKLMRVNCLRKEITLTLCSDEGLTLEASFSASNRKVTTKG